MIILEKSDCILFYFVNANYFDKFSGVSCGISGSNFWRTSEANTNTFTHHIHFTAKDEHSDEKFIECKSRFICTVRIEDEIGDAVEMMNLIKTFRVSLNKFIKENSLSHFSKLNLREFEISESALKSMQSGIERLKAMTAHKDKTELEKKIEQEIREMEIGVKVIKVKNTIQEQ